MINNFSLSKLLHFLLGCMTKGVSLIDGGVDTTSSWWDNVINDYIRQVQVRVDGCHLLQAIVKPVTIIAIALIII